MGIDFWQFAEKFGVFAVLVVWFVWQTAVREKRQADEREKLLQLVTNEMKTMVAQTTAVIERNNDAMDRVTEITTRAINAMDRHHDLIQDLERRAFAQNTNRPV